MSKFIPEPEKTLVDSSVKSRLVTWVEGERLINEWFSNWWTEFERNMEPFMVNWRGWQGKRTAFRIFLKLWAIAHIELQANLFPHRRKRRGMQKIVTRNWVTREVRGGVEVGKFSGKIAWKRRRGRPPLPLSVAVERLQARVQAKRAKNKTETVHKDRKPLAQVKVRQTQMPRPTTGENFGKSEIKENPAPIIETDTLHEERSDSTNAALVQSIGDAIKELNPDVASRFLDHVRDMLGVAYSKSEKSFVDDAFDSIFGAGQE